MQDDILQEELNQFDPEQDTSPEEENEDLTPEEEYQFPEFLPLESYFPTADTFSDEYIRDMCSGETIQYLTYEEHHICYSIKQSEMNQQSYEVQFVFFNLILGVIMGFIAMKGLFEPWNK